MRDKVAFITGSAKGLGKTTALRLADEGCNIALNYVHSQAEAEALKRVIESKGVRCLSLQGDISVQEDITRLIGEVQDRLGGVDIMVNNAGPFIRERR
ncbi:SDR family NAD(P)-dependent oxidoreductase, partial [Paenibacillus sp. EKM208P]